MKKKKLINAFSMYASLGKAYCDAAEKLISICREQHPDVATLLVEIQNQTAAAVCVCETIVAWLANETSRLPKIEWNCFAIDFEGLVNKLKESHLSFTHYFHTSEVTKVLERLSSFNYYSWQKDVQFLSNPHSILFLGDPGTGKTHGLGAFSEKVMAEGLHLPIIIQARSIKPAQAWRDIIIQTLGLGNTYPVGNTGIDVAIRRTHHAATHGACSRVMTVCEKYIWQARSYISGFLCDHLLFGNDQIQVCDYGLVDDFIIPLQELTQFDPNDIPKNRPWHIPAPESVLRGSESKSAEEVIMSIKDAPDINWRDWICINNSDHKYSICADSLISINQYSCFFSPAGVETCLFINTVIMPTKEVTLSNRDPKVFMEY